MQEFTRLYVMLRPVRGTGCGYARLEGQGRQGRMSLHLSQLPQGLPMLRALLLSGDVATGAVLDAGVLPPSPSGRAFLRAEPMLLPEGTSLRDFHTLAVCADWPEARLILSGALDEQQSPPLWQLQEAVRQYLTVPAAAPVKKPPADEAQAALFTIEKGIVPARPMARRLLPLQWPEAWQELQPYFRQLTPFAPFEAPGWRFVQVTLPPDGPAPWCAVGYHARHGQVQRVAYALPAGESTSPPPEAADWTLTAGRNDMRYWVKLLP